MAQSDEKSHGLFVVDLRGFQLTPREAEAISNEIQAAAQKAIASLPSHVSVTSEKIALRGPIYGFIALHNSQ